MKSIILSGESKLDKFVSHRTLYFLGFLTGWNERIFSLEILPIAYFLIWAIVLFSLKEPTFGLLFLSSAIINLVYFIILHSVISIWDRIKHWFIRRARKRGGVKNLNLEDIKYLLIYTRKVFGVKSSIPQTEEGKYSSDDLKISLNWNRRWYRLLNIVIIFTLLTATGGGIYLFIARIEIFPWLNQWWWTLLLLLLPLSFAIIAIIISKKKIREVINKIPSEEFDKVLRILNEFEVFGSVSKTNVGKD